MKDRLWLAGFVLAVAVGYAVGRRATAMTVNEQGEVLSWR